MAVTVKIPLEMKNEVKVRNLSELREHFDIEKVQVEGLVDSSSDKQIKLHRNVEKVKCNDKKVDIGSHKNNTYISFMLSTEDKEISEEMFVKLKEEIVNIDYDIDKDVKETKEMLLNKGVVGLAERYLENL